MNDCEALAEYVGAIADSVGSLSPSDAAKQLDVAMTMLTPLLQKNGVTLPLPGGVVANATQLLNPTGAPSGYQTLF